jgi:ubiquinone/menaquinone biosynthesis C-methylase UbiE
MPSRMRILEIGCGSGRMTRALAELFGQVHAVDISGEMLEQARTALAGCSNVHLDQNSGSGLELFGDSEFDFVFSAIVFQHIPRKSIVENYVREAYRVLRPGSVFKCQFEGHPIPEHITDTWRGASFSTDDVARMAAECGFDVKASIGAGTQYFWVTFFKPSPLLLPYRPTE